MEALAFDCFFDKTSEGFFILCHLWRVSLK